MVIDNWKLVILSLITGLVLAACGRGSAQGAEPTLDPVAELGQRIFQTNCAACHSTVADVVIQGPSLAGIATRAETRVEGMDARAYIQASLFSPDAYVVEGFNDMMPNTFSKSLTGEELDALVEFLLTLK